ncbi:DUF4116 domain-containing protein [Durusdinium trenchii]|uniref:DUF4116 domain-containing protein n=1 Tax=Durusdinium trenchii TaxID=1381693 RepID=A0ABP0PYW1_9DINO
MASLSRASTKSGLPRMSTKTGAELGLPRATLKGEGRTSTKKVALTWEKEIERNWWKLALAPEEYTNNREVVMSAIKQDGLALRHASSELQNDWSFVAAAVCRDGEALQFASPELRNDSKMARWAMGIRDAPSGQINIEEWTGPDLSEYNNMATGRTAQPNCLRHASAQLRGKDQELMLHAIREYWFAADHLTLPLRESKPFWRKVLEQNERTGWQAFGNYAPVFLREDEELMNCALQFDPMALHFAGPALRKRRSFVLEAVQRDWRSLRCAPAEYQADVELLVAAAMQNLEALEYAGGELKSVALRAVQPPSRQILEEEKETWTGLQDAEEVEKQAKKQKEICQEWNRVMLQLSSKHGRALSFMRPTGVDARWTLEAVKGNGVALAYAEAQYREDREIVNESVRANIGTCSGLIWAPDSKLPEIRDDLVDDYTEKEKGQKKKRGTLKQKRTTVINS